MNRSSGCWSAQGRETPKHERSARAVSGRVVAAPASSDDQPQRSRAVSGREQRRTDQARRRNKAGFCGGGAGDGAGEILAASCCSACPVWPFCYLIKKQCADKGFVSKRAKDQPLLRVGQKPRCNPWSSPLFAFAVLNRPRKVHFGRSGAHLFLWRFEVLKGDHHFAGLGARFCFFGSVLKGTQRKTTLFGKREGGTTHFVKSDACFFLGWL